MIGIAISRNTRIIRGETKRLPGRRAFTLIEILVALSMIALILAAVYGSYVAATTAIAHSKPRSVLEQQARLFLQRMTCELRCCYPGGKNEFREITSERPSNEDVVERERIPLFVSEEISSDKTFLRFVTTAVTTRQDYSVGGLVMVSYRLNDSGSVLLRNERKYISGLEADNNHENDENWLRVLPNVEAITFEYYDGEKWQGEWDSNEKNGLPLAVRTSLCVETGETGPLSFVSCARIGCRGYQTSVETEQRAPASGGDSP